MKGTGRRVNWGTVIIVFAIMLSTNTTCVTANEPSKGEITKVIQDHIEWYFIQLPTQFEAAPFSNVADIRKAESYGIVRTVLKSGLNIGDKNRSLSNALIGDVFKVEITPKGQNIPHFITPDNKIIFQTMTRKIDEIIKIETDDKYNYTVYFSYSGVPTELGRAIVFDRDIYKYKGKAIIAYDVFTKQYVMDNLYWSPWDRLEWQGTDWINVEDGKKVIKKTK